MHISMESEKSTKQNTILEQISLQVAFRLTRLQVQQAKMSVPRNQNTTITIQLMYRFRMVSHFLFKYFKIIIGQSYIMIRLPLKNNKMNATPRVLHIQRKSNLLPLSSIPEPALPAICTPRHYLMRSLSKNTSNLSNALDPQVRRRIINKYQNHESRTTIYNIEFKKRQVDSKKHTAKTISYDEYMKSSSLERDKGTFKPKKQNARWRISNFFHKQSSRASIDLSDSNGKLKTISINSQLSNINSQSSNMSMNGFSPRMTRLDLTKKQIQFLTQNLQRYKQFRSMEETKEGIIIQPIKNSQDQSCELNKDNIKKRNMDIRNRYTYHKKKTVEPERVARRKEGVSCTPWHHEENPEELADFE